MERKEKQAEASFSVKVSLPEEYRNKLFILCKVTDRGVSDILGGPLMSVIDRECQKCRGAVNDFFNR